MRSMAQAFLLLILMAVASKLYGQKFNVDGTMVLTEVSTDPKYGYEANHKTAIKVGKIANERPYLEALRSPAGFPVSYERLGSCCSFECSSSPFGMGLLDIYEVTYRGAGKSFTIYLNPYESSTPKAPSGFSFVAAGNLEKPVIYPKDSIVWVSRCNKRWIYSANDFLLEKEFGAHPAPDTNPVYNGGIEALSRYFSERPLTDERLSGRSFGVAIGFLVNCEGKAGRFVIISQGLGNVITFLNQVLERVNNMPQNWRPATKKGKNVDAYQLLFFEVTDGKLDKVSYR